MINHKKIFDSIKTFTANFQVKKHDELLALLEKKTAEISSFPGEKKELIFLPKKWAKIETVRTMFHDKIAANVI